MEENLKAYSSLYILFLLKLFGFIARYSNSWILMDPFKNYLGITSLYVRIWFYVQVGSRKMNAGGMVRFRVGFTSCNSYSITAFQSFLNIISSYKFFSIC